MLFPDEDSPLLKAWIVKRLENTSDADADVLADYVLALLHGDDGSEDIRAKCMSEMGNFLTEDPSSFVNDLFETIQYRSYVPGAPPPPKPAPAIAPPSTLPGLGDPNAGQPPTTTGASVGSARKRGFQDRGDFDAPTGQDPFPGGRPYKQPRRGGGFGGRKGYIDPDRPQPMPQEQYTFQNPPGQHAPSFAQPGLVPQIPAFDPNNPMESIRQLQQISQQIGLSLQNYGDYSQQQPGFQNTLPQQGRKGRCWDFDRKGFCPRGLKCKFNHSTGTEPVMYSLPVPQISGQIPLPSEEYDPTSATLSQPQQMPPLPQQPLTYQGNGHLNQNRNNRQGQQRRKTGQTRAPFSADGPVYDRTQTKIVVESIPEENFDEDQVRNFFSQFGNVEEVTMMGYKRLAVVKFDNWASANAAYKSPKVIFDNRFVKVYWYKEEKHGEAANGGHGANSLKPGQPSNGVKREASADIKMEDMDMEEFTRKQEGAQRLHEAKMAKIREIHKQREELEMRQKELQAKQAAEKQRLMEKLADSRKNSTEPGRGSEAAAAGAKGAETSQTEALKATLARLRGEAVALGIDPNVPQQDDNAAMSTPYAPGYGRGGRGGYFRGLGGYSPRGAWRGGRGGGRGNLHAAYAAFSLDNRPKTVAISGVDFSEPEKDEALRRHLFTVDGVTEIQTTPAVTHLSFSNRKQAEAFYDSVKTTKIPGVNDGGDAVELSWVAGTAAALPGSKSTSVNRAASGTGVAAGKSGEGLDSATGDGDADNGEAGHPGAGDGGKANDHDGAEEGAHEGESQHGQQQSQQHESGESKEVVDYDVAGENEWDE